MGGEDVMSSLTKRCMASIESLLSYSTQPAYTELDLLVGSSRLEQDSLSMQDYGLVTETTLTMDDFQSLPSDQQSDQIFKLLAILSPLANEVCDLKCSIGEMLSNYNPPPLSLSLSPFFIKIFPPQLRLTRVRAGPAWRRTISSRERRLSWRG